MEPVGVIVRSIFDKIFVFFSVCMAVTSGVSVKISVPSETWAGDGALMTCTVGGNISKEDIRIDWYKWTSGTDKHRVFLFVNSENLHRAEKDLVDTSNKPRAVGQLVGYVYHLYINKTVLSDDAVYSCVLDPNGDFSKLTVNGE